MTESVTAARVQRAWPGAIEWGGDWLGETARELRHLGFVLRDGSHTGNVPGPRLLVALRARPTLEHFDPELATFWEVRDGRGRVATVDLGVEVPSSRRWSWGPVRITDRIPVSNGFLGFGGTLLIDALDPTTICLAFTSRAPILRWAGHSQGVDALADEIGAFFARLMVPVDYQPEAEARIAAADPEALYAVFVGHSIERLHRSRRLRDADPRTAGWLEHECYRLQHDVPGRWSEGQELLAWLELG